MSLAARVLAVLVLWLVGFVAGYWTGDRQRDNAWLAKESAAVRAAHQQYEAERERGLQAAGHYLTTLSDQEDRYDQLDDRFKALRQRTALLVHAAAAPQPPAPAAGSEPDQPAQPCIQAVSRPELSLAAVRMWDSALAGADVPAGACGAAAEAGQACAAASGLTVEDALDNHTLNARLCAADRRRFEHLIDYLQGRTP